MKASALFDELEKGILQILKAADLYNLHLIALARNEEPSKELIQRLLTTNTISVFAVMETFYSDHEKEDFNKHEYLRAIGNQIILATYTALECYLIEKFYEYLKYKEKDKDPKLTVSRRSLGRSLEDIKDHYRKILDIHLRLFELNEAWYTHPSFKPSDTWERIKAIEKARHEIAHLGKSESIASKILSDAWDPFDFIRRWVSAFEANFNSLIFDGRPTALIASYQERVADRSNHSRS